MPASDNISGSLIQITFPPDTLDSILIAKDIKKDNKIIREAEPYDVVIVSLGPGSLRKILGKKDLETCRFNFIRVTWCM